MRSRRGFSLVELLVVLSVGTVMLTMAISVLYMLKETQANVRERLTTGRMIVRLSDRFREDVHAASQIERVSDEALSPDTAVWQFTIHPNSMVRYEMRGREVRRGQTTGGDKSHDDFRLPSNVRATLRPPEPGSELTTLRFEVVNPNVAMARPIQIEALLGFSHRHSPQADRTGD